MNAPRVRILAASFASVPGIGPRSSALLSLVEALRAQVDLVTLKTDRLRHTERIGDARMFRVPVGTAADALDQVEIYRRAVQRQLESTAYQFAHVLDPYAGAVAAENGVGVVYEALTFPDEALVGTWQSAHLNTLKHAERILVPTEAAAAHLREQCPHPERIVVLAPAVDISTYDVREAAQFGMPRMLYLGPLTDDRGIPEVIEAVGKIAGHRPVRLLMVGERDPARRRRVRALAAKAKLSAMVSVRGEPETHAIADLICGANVCLAPASPAAAARRQLPQPLAEYAACLRPVVAASVPGIEEILDDDVECLLYSPGESNGLADAVMEMLRDSDKRERLTTAAYQKVRAQLTLGNRRRYLYRLYDELIPGSQSRDPWADFEDEVTGISEVPDFDLAFGEGSDTIRPPPFSTTEFSPSETQPALVVPDTDPAA